MPDNSGFLATIEVWAELLWSTTNPNHEYGLIGRLISLEFNIPGIDTHYPSGIESMFSWSDETEEARMSAIRDEFKFLLLRMGWLLKDDLKNGQLTVQVNSMV